MRDFWYKNAIIYSLDVETYMDGNGDGVGDFIGLTKRLDYLAGLGVNCIWLLPFFPSPNLDDGYDVMDYYNVDPRMGTLGDFVEFTHQAHNRGISVIVDLVLNHTSDQHPWFQQAKDQSSPYRDYYVWSKDKPTKEEQGEAVFPEVDPETWTYDEKAGAYYLHHFYKHQPDLNTANPEVQEEIRKILGFWLQLGVSGFRIDAAPYLINPLGIKEVQGEELERLLPEMREVVSERQGNALLLAEANVEPEKIKQYFGNGDRMHMMFNFLLNQYMFLAIVREQAEPLKRGLGMLPEIPESCQWLNFIRNHDELTLNYLSKEEQAEVFQEFAPEEDMKIYGRGIRRRLAPMLRNDRTRAEMFYSLCFSLPGTPMLRYGDEIGMGDDLSLQERNSVRTPMQWRDANNGGFSIAAAEKLAKPVVTEGEYSYHHVNVANQQRDPDSLMNWIERLVRIRHQCPEFGRGKYEILEVDQPNVFAHCCKWGDGMVIALHNLSKQPCTATLKSGDVDPKSLYECWRDRHYEQVTDRSFELEGYGYRWFRVSSELQS